MAAYSDKCSFPHMMTNRTTLDTVNRAFSIRAHVNIVLGPDEIPAELRDELRAWDKTGDEAWSFIDHSEGR